MIEKGKNILPRHRYVGKKILTGVIIILAALCPGLALEPGKPLTDYLVDHWDSTGGLPSNLIHAISQTADGYLWVATNKGLVRFDGRTFSAVPFTGNKNTPAIAEALYLDNTGKLWIGGSASLTRYDYKTGAFKTFTTVHGISDGKIRRIMKDVRGNLWLGFEAHYVNRFTNGIFTPFYGSHGLHGHIINGLVEDQNGVVLVGTRNNGIFTFREGRFFKFPVSGATYNPLKNANGFLISMFEDRDGALWISTNKGLLRKTGDTVQTFTVQQGLSSNHTSALMEDRDRNLWVGSVRGLNRLIREPGARTSGIESTRTPGFEYILKPFTIICLFEDMEGSLWVGTYKSGLKRLKNSKFKSFSPLASSPNEILFSMYRERNGDILVGTSSGKLIRSRQNICIGTVSYPELSDIGIMAINRDGNGNLWLGTNGQGAFKVKGKSLNQFNKSTKSTKSTCLAQNLVTLIFKDSRKDLWFGTFDGISVRRWTTGKFVSFKKEQGLPGNKIHAIYEDRRSNIWLAADKGVAVLEQGVFPDNEAGPESRPLTGYLPGITVTWIYEEPTPAEKQGRIFWLASHGSGLIRLTFKDGQSTPSITHYTSASGMTTDYLYRFFDDLSGNFWLMSDSGILRIAKSQLNLFAQGRLERVHCLSFGLSEGLKNPEFNSPFPGHSAFRTDSGRLFFLNKKEISMVNPSAIRINKQPPPIVLEEVSIGGQPVHLPIEPGQSFEEAGDLHFRFLATTLLSPDKVIYRYMLEGVDRDWVFLPPGSTPAALYKNLEPGAYTFRVTAANAEGVWNPAGIAVQFHLERPFTGTLLFKTLVILFSALLVGLILWVVFKKVAPEQEAGREKVKQRGTPLHPDFVRECITKLTYLMEVDVLYRDGTLTLHSLAEKLNIPYYQLSQLLNDHLKIKFSDYINRYRVEEAKKILADPPKSKETIQAISVAVGFNTLTAFYKAFKKHTGLTPGDFKKQSQKKNG